MLQFFERTVNYFNMSFDSIASIKVTDAIDILLVAFIIHFFLKWIRGTRAWSLFKGIIILIVLRGVFLLLRLYTLSWILKSLFDGGLIALMILFQPEIRKLLEEMGSGTFILSKEENDSTESNKEIIKAIRIMSSTKTGALICIEQDVPLGEYEKTGIPIDAKITSQLIVNIFEDKTPLHDGAVVMRNNRIAAAGCILPVTSQEIGKELGTRHRAAVGLSELSDAIVLVVSEETGTISISRAGKIKRDLKAEEIYDILQATNNEESKKGRFFRLGRDKK